MFAIIVEVSLRNNWKLSAFLEVIELRTKISSSDNYQVHYIGRIEAETYMYVAMVGRKGTRILGRT